MTYAAEASRPTYPALAEVSRVIASHGDLSELFEKLAEYLRPLLGFHYLSVALHDDDRQVMRLHILQSLQKTESTPGLEFPITESPSGEVWTCQERRNFGSLNELRRYHPSAFEILREHAVESFCVLPLTTAHRRIGAIAFGRSAAGGYHEEELAFAEQVAAQVAVAMDNGLRYEEGLTLQRELAHERDRLQSVLDINNSVVSNLELRDLFRALSASLRRVIAHDSATLMLPDTLHPGMLRIHALDFPESRGFLQQDMLMSISNSNPGKAFQSGQTMLVGSGPNSVPFTNSSGARVAQGEGLRCSLVLPLILNGTEKVLAC